MCEKARIRLRPIRGCPRSRDSSLLESRLPCLQPRLPLASMPCTQKGGDPKAAPLQNAYVPHWRSPRRCGAFALLRLLQQAVTAVVATIQHVDQVRCRGRCKRRSRGPAGRSAPGPLPRSAARTRSPSRARLPRRAVNSAIRLFGIGLFGRDVAGDVGGLFGGGPCGRCTLSLVFAQAGARTLAAATSMAAYMSSSDSFHADDVALGAQRDLADGGAGRWRGSSPHAARLRHRSGSMSMTFMELPILSSAYSRSASVTGILRPVTVMLMSITSSSRRTKKTDGVFPAQNRKKFFQDGWQVIPFRRICRYSIAHFTLI